jgi:hypothetical protein
MSNAFNREKAEIVRQQEPVSILIIDDEPRRHRGLETNLLGKASLVVLDPSLVRPSDLDGVDLISVDHYLGDDWASFLDSAETVYPSSIKNQDGLAVAAAMRSHARVFGRNFAVTLHTGALRDLAAGIPARSREPLTAAQHDLDWVFSFGERAFGERLVNLALAVRSVTNSVADLRISSGADWLELGTVTWRSEAVATIEECRPPAHALAEVTKGRSYLRWLAQRILPYPTFLLDDSCAANRLGISNESFEALVGRSTLLSKVLYSGPLRSFLGRRWWKAGLDDLLREAGVSASRPPATRADAVATLSGLSITGLTSGQPVIQYDYEGSVVSTDMDSSQGAVVKMDGWPVFADDPWASVESIAADSRLFQLLSDYDKHRLKL